jgi:hypothetical protein
VLAAVEDVHERHRQVRAPSPAQVAVQRQADGSRRGMGDRQADPEQRVGAELRLVRRPVEDDQQRSRLTWSSASSPSSLGDRRRSRGDGVEDALAAVARGVAVAELDRLVGAGRRPDGTMARPDRRRRRGHVDLDRRVAARVEDLAADDVLDQVVTSPLPSSAARRQQRLDAGQRLALEELERGAAAGADVASSIGRGRAARRPPPSRRRRR